MLFLPHEPSHSVPSCTTEKSRRHSGNASTLICQAGLIPSDRESPQGQAQDVLPVMTDICLPASLTCSGPVGKESGRTAFLSALWNSFTSYGIIRLEHWWSSEEGSFFWRTLFSSHIFSCIFSITFLANFVSNLLSPWVFLLSLIWPEKVW